MHAVAMTDIDANARFSQPLFELQIYHACDRVVREGADLDFALRRWTMLPGFPRRYLASAEELATHERRTLALIHACWDRQAGAVEPQRIVEESRAWLAELIADVVARWRRLPPQNSWYGCFCTTHEPGQDLAAFHFYNCACPASPFTDADALRDDLRQCLLALRRESPQVRRIQCGSWVNNLSPIQALLPRAYRQSLVKTDPDGKSGLGWWGQFVSSDGGLNEQRAAELRATGIFHYARLLGHCSLDEALSHLGAA